MPSDINETIAEVLRLDAEATQGPWHYEPHWGDVYDFTGKPPYRSRQGVTDDFEDGAAIVGARGQDVIYEGTFTAYEQTAGHIGLTEEDHTLIAYYRTAAPVLAREVQRLQAEVDRLRGPHRRCYHCLEDLPQGATDDCCDGCRDQLRRDEEVE